MKMHVVAADRPQGHTAVLTLWPLASTATDKNECFVMCEREALWAMRPGKGMGRTSDNVRYMHAGTPRCTTVLRCFVSSVSVSRLTRSSPPHDA